MITSLIIAAHPDDEILGCGGTIKKLSSEEDFYVLILTYGVENRYPKEMETRLKENARKANKLVGTKEVFFENLPNQGLDAIPILDVITTIEKYMSQIKPDRVFTHHGGDLNRDHRVVHEASMVATRPISGQCAKQVYSYHVASSTEWNQIKEEDIFIPNVFIDISDTISAKIGAMKCYSSECRPFPHPRSPEALEVYSQYWGITVGMKNVEIFRLIRDLRGSL
jgi:LmbE family N-acetylglucosaminyl deacetylase